MSPLSYSYPWLSTSRIENYGKVLTSYWNLHCTDHMVQSNRCLLCTKWRNISFCIFLFVTKEIFTHYLLCIICHTREHLYFLPTLPHYLTISQSPWSCRYLSLWIFFAYCCYLWSLSFYLCRFLLLLLIAETATWLTPYWRQPLFQILTKLPLILKFSFHKGW